MPADARFARTVAVSVARGMAYLHSRSPPILHLDLKSANILVDERGRVKVADFGLSRARHRTYASAAASGGAGGGGGGAGTPEWTAPEVLRCGAYAEPCDVYSVGVVLWELLTGQPPWAELSPMQVVGAVGYGGARLPSPTAAVKAAAAAAGPAALKAAGVVEGTPAAAAAAIDPFLERLCLACMDPDPAARPTFAGIVAALDAQYGPPQWSSSASPRLQCPATRCPSGSSTRARSSSAGASRWAGLPRSLWASTKARSWRSSAY